MQEDRVPVLVGVAQLVQKDVDPAEALEPIAMMERTARAAGEDAGLAGGRFEKIDCLGVVNVLGHDYGNAPRLLAERLGLRPTSEIYTAIGGNSPQSLLNEVAHRIATGRVGLALLCGAEALATHARARRSGASLAWTPPVEGPPTEILGSDRPGSNEHEAAHGLTMPIEVYPLFENALRARSGRNADEHQRRLGEMYARFSAIAAKNPYAWFRTPRDAAEIFTVDADNRMIGYPYPKRMNAIKDVDQSASVIVTSAAKARALGLPEDRWVFLAGAAGAEDHWWVSDRVDHASSPAIRAAGRAALEMAGVSIDEIDAIDLYSCFPAAVQIARAAFGIAEDDPRPLTVTGGLAYAGGPASNYPMHSIATLVERIRANRRTIGLATGLGWYVTKHAVGVYTGEPPRKPWPAALPHLHDARPGPEFTREPAGRGRIETFTVLHDRSGAPARGIVFGRLDDDRRFLANVPPEPSALEALMQGEAVGRRGRVTAGAVNRFDPS